MAAIMYDASDLTPKDLAKDYRTDIIATAAVFLGLECSVYSARLYCRVVKKISYGRDDVLIALGLLANVAQNIVSIIVAAWVGLGQHERELNFDHEFRLLFAMEWTYSLAVCLPKLAILELYLRIFSARTFRLACYGTMAVVLTTSLATSLTATFQCRPVKAAWNPTLPGAVCIDQIAYLQWASLPNIVTDIIIVVLPISSILKLQLNRRKTLELLAIFLCGGAGLIFSILRFIIFFSTYSLGGVIYSSILLVIMTCVEPGMYFICACLPGVWPLITEIGLSLRRDMIGRLGRICGGSKKGSNKKEPHQMPKPRVFIKTSGETLVRASPARDYGDDADPCFGQIMDLSCQGRGIAVRTDIESTSERHSLP